MPGPEPKIEAAQTVRTALTAASARLRAAGVEHADNDARHLLAAVLGVSGARMLGHPEQSLAAEQAELFAAHIARRAAREPVSRILGEREFYGRPFAVSPATLDPRPDSETLIDAALDIVRSAKLDAEPLRLLDVGTGSGCLLVTLLCELPHATGLGTDVSQAALAVARTNAVRLGVRQRASWVRADALDGIKGDFDILVCNPPYIATPDIAALDPEVRVYDPLAALDGGPDGLQIYRRLAPRIASVVRRGWALLEVGYNQADAVVRLLASANGKDPAEFTFHKDVAGKRRCVAWKTRD